MEFLPLYEFHKCVQRYQGDYKARSFSCMDQFLSMVFAQLTYRESLRDIESCLRFMRPKLYHMGFRGSISKSTLADANNQRDWHIYADFAQVLIHRARKLYLHEPFGVELKQAAYALDATTIDLCLSLFPWARFRQNKAAVKLHTLLDLRGNIPTFIQITDGKVHDVNILDILIPEAGSFYIMDRGYLDFVRLYALHQDKAFFITRSKSNIQHRRLYSRPVDKINRPTLRSDNCFDDLPIRQRLSGKTPADQIFRCRAQSTADIFNQSLGARCHQDCSTLQMPLEDRTVFQMDQTTPAYQSIFRHIRKRRQNSNLDCDIHLRANRHYQERAKTQAKPLHNSTDFKRDHFQQNIYIASTYGN